MPEIDLKRKKEKKEKKQKREKESNEINEIPTKEIPDSNEALKKEKKARKEKKQKREAESNEINELKTNENTDSNTSNTALEEIKSINSSNSKWIYSENSTNNLSVSEISKFMTENVISVTPSLNVKSVDPLLSFSQLTLPTKLQSKITFDKPTCIQSISWPVVMQGHDFVGIASTGSGKTLAFGLPALLHVHNKSKQDRMLPSVLVLSPTRELAMQIHEQLDSFGTSLGINSICLYGGVSKYNQKQDYSSKKFNIIIATPGRLVDLMNEGFLDLSNVDYFVLDEADRMLDLGFEPEIIKICLNLAPKDKRQTVIWPTAIQSLSGKYLNNPVRITVGSTDLSANINITQHVEVIDPASKDRRLLELLTKYHSSRKNRVLVFCLYKKEATRVEQFLSRHGYNAASLSGDLEQSQRTYAINAFRDGSCPLLVATDVAARGLDIPNVEYVINYTYPLTTEEYCHRIGRTGRAGSKGISYSLFTVHDKTHSGALINVLKQANQIVPQDLLNFGTTVKKKLDPNYGAFVKDIDPNQKATKIVFDSDDD